MTLGTDFSLLALCTLWPQYFETHRHNFKWWIYVTLFIIFRPLLHVCSSKSISWVFLENLKLVIFQIVNKNCFILENTVTRYKAILNNLYQISQREIQNRDSWSQEKDIKFMFRRYRVEKVAREENRKHYKGNIQGLNINLTRPCDEYPNLGMNENCMSMHILLT